MNKLQTTVDMFRVSPSPPTRKLHSILVGNKDSFFLEAPCQVLHINLMTIDKKEESPCRLQKVLQKVKLKRKRLTYFLITY